MESRPTLTPLLVVFLDLTRFNAQAQHTDEAELAPVLDEYYELVGDAVKRAGGTVVKFIGDACLAVFPESAADAGVEMLLGLKDDVDRFMQARGWECRLSAKAHFGPVMAGPFGERGAKRFDVLGRTVNTTARLEAHGVTLSADAAGRLGAGLRGRFRAHTTPGTWVRADAPGAGGPAR